ncbi:MAG: HD domain-containing protein [Candidatus Methanoperedens sp.]|nr:HD domain-containing protein [Candidatus Methanoperedens sp.]MCZ7370394.1 HD domain-containing protein [Candidatus Methanoperedens sp.]
MPSIIDPIYGHVGINRLEQLIISTPEMARLRRIQQLGLADIAFPGANHTRFEHSVGTLFIADKMAKALGLSQEEVAKVRLAALLHDIGHCAFSHVVESVLKRNPAYQPVIDGRRFLKHEMFTRYIISNSFHTKPEIASLVVDAKSFFEEIAKMATGDVDGLSKPYLAQIISDDLDADRIDFLLRDSYHTGVSLGLVDVDQIVGSLSLSNGRIVLGGSLSYDEDMSLTAAESMLIARAHHYSAIIHNPKTQGARVMLLQALDKALARYKETGNDVKAVVLKFFTAYTDTDLLNFIEAHGDASAKNLIDHIRHANICSAVVRFTHKNLNPRTRMALSTIARNGVAKKMFEEELSRRFAKKYGASVLVDLDVASGIPRSTRIKIGDYEGFLYDESALANGLVRAISRQISLCVFSRTEDDARLSQASHDFLLDIENLSPKLLHFIRNETSLPIEGILLIFYSAHRMFSREAEGRITMPRLRNIAKIYYLARELGNIEKLRNLFDYRFHTRYGFPYSDRLFEDIQLLVAMGMVDEDLRYFENSGRWKQRYEYVLTSDGLSYAELIAPAYQNELKMIEDYLSLNKHSIPRDMVSIASQRYGKEVREASNSRISDVP